MSVSKLTVHIEGRAFHVEIEDLQVRPIVVMVDGERFEITPETDSANTSHGSATSPESVPDRISRPVGHNGNGASQYSSSGGAAPQGNGPGDVHSPLPGTVLSVAVAPGERVAVGQELCTLEAMKMKNLIRATHAGTVTEVLVSPGQTVKHNQLLLRYVRHAD